MPQEVLGAAASEALAENNYHVIAIARTTGALEELDDRIQSKGGSATLVPLDITDEEAVKRMCILIHERWGGLDLWVHCAIHASPLSPVSHISEKDWEKNNCYKYNCNWQTYYKFREFAPSQFWHSYTY